MNDFEKFVETKNMIEMRCLGRRYTWSNGHIHSNIDWILVNPAKMGVYSRVYHGSTFIRSLSFEIFIM